MKYKLILVALLLAFLVAVSASAVSAADDVISEDVSADYAIDSGDSNEVLCDGQLGAEKNKDVWIDNSIDESKIYVEGTMEVVARKNPDAVLITGVSASRYTTYSNSNTSSVESYAIDDALRYAKMITGASDIEVTKIDRNVSSSTWDHRAYDSIVDNNTKTVTHLVTGSYAKITTVKLHMVVEYNKEDQKLIETKLTAKYDAATKNIIATVKDENGNPIRGLKVGFAIDGVKYTTSDENGQARYSTADLANGTYKVSVKAYGNEIYNDSNKEKITFIIGSNQQSKIYLRNALYFVLELKYVTVTLWDANNNPIANKTVYLTLNEYGIRYSGVTSENGNAFIRIGVGFGVHSATVSFDGDDQYNASERTGSIRVIKETPSVMVRGADAQFKASDNPKIVKVYLWDRTSIPLPARSKIFIKINGQTFVGTTDSDGIAHIPININSPGTFNAQVIYAGNSAYNAVTRNVKISVK